MYVCMYGDFALEWTNVFLFLTNLSATTQCLKENTIHTLHYEVEVKITVTMEYKQRETRQTRYADKVKQK